MAEPVNLDDWRVQAASVSVGKSLNSNVANQGGGGGMDGTEARLRRLEEDGKEIRADLKTVLRDLSEIKGAMATKTELGDLRVATTKDVGDLRLAVGKLETRVEKLPTLGKIAVLVTIAVGVLTLITKGPEVYHAWSQPAQSLPAISGSPSSP